MSTGKKKVTIIGSGNWGSAIARIVGSTVKSDPEKKFDETVVMWVWEETINGEKLSEIINTKHENVKYLPGRILPSNVVAVPDLMESIKDTDILIFVVPHQFVEKLCDQMAGKVKSTALGVSLIKGFETDRTRRFKNLKGLEPRTDDGPERGIKLISEIIKEKLGIECCVLMGANLAREVAAENFCEATVGAETKENGQLLKDLFQTDYFRINHVYDAHTVELCGALKNVVACAAGFTDGLGYGDNTKSAVIRLGLMEMTKFIEKFYPGSNLETFFESCGIADLVTTCYGGRNRKVCEAFVKTGKTLEELEVEMLGGQNLQGPHTADQVMKMLQEFKMENRFPLFAAVYKVCHGELKPAEMIDCLRNHPEHFDRN